MGMIRVTFGFIIAWASFTLILGTENILTELLGIIVLLGGLYLIAWSEKLEVNQARLRSATYPSPSGPEPIPTGELPDEPRGEPDTPKRRPIQHRAINMPLDEDELSDEQEDTIQRHRDDK